MQRVRDKCWQLSAGENLRLRTAAGGTTGQQAHLWRTVYLHDRRQGLLVADFAAKSAGTSFPKGQYPTFTYNSASRVPKRATNVAALRSMCLLPPNQGTLPLRLTLVPANEKKLPDFLQDADISVVVGGASTQKMAKWRSCDFPSSHPTATHHLRP